MAGISEALNFGEHGGDGKAAGFSANKWNDAERATRIAAVLNFEGWAGVIPFSAEDGGDEDVREVKNIAGENGGCGLRIALLNGLQER